MEITVLTSTYNRGERIHKLYKSLLEQTDKDFEWVIIDDGSVDNTEKVVDEFVDDGKILIKYYKKQNGGKHTALNMGVSKIETDLTFIVDSDDWLEKNAIENVKKCHRQYKNNDEICGYSFLRKYSNGNINGKLFKTSEFIDDYINVRINGKDTNSDKAEVWKTKYLKEYPFPEFKQEKFLGEDVVWIQLALKYKMVFLNEAIYISEYLEEGLTKNRRRNNINSPKGCYYRSRITLEACSLRKINFKYFIKNLLQLQIYGRFAGRKYKEMKKDCKCKLYFEIMYPLSYIIYLKWRRLV